VFKDRRNSGSTQFVSSWCGRGSSNSICNHLLTCPYGLLLSAFCIGIIIPGILVVDVDPLLSYIIFGFTK